MKNKKVKRYHESENSSQNHKNEKRSKKHKNTGQKPNKSLNSKRIVEIRPNLKAKTSHYGAKHKVERGRFPGRAPISKETLEKYSKGEGLEGKGVMHPRYLKKLKIKEKHIKFATQQAARAEILLSENKGYLEADEGETTTQFTQKKIAESVDIAAATKYFELFLDQFGPYKMRYSRNGRHLLLGGKMGHVAAFDWVTKHLHCEINVMESVHDVCWMHTETMFGVAQKDWVYLYDNKGTEIHCLKSLYRVLKMEFLPYHFLLATGTETGHLSWLDISIGQIIGNYKTNIGRISAMKQNPYNGVICVGEGKGIVSMWSPTVKSPLATLLCHKAPLTAITIDPKGIYMATTAVDKNIKIWDIRKLNGPLQYYKLRSSPSHLDFSDNHLLGVGLGNVIEVYKDCCAKDVKKPYLKHTMNAYVESMSFCPYEDVLGVGTNRGFVSLIVPGSGEANFDALESNPYQTKSQRREAEVKALLEKIQPELISLDPQTIIEVDLPTLKDRIETHNELKQLKPQKIDYTPRRKTRHKGTAKIARNKKIIQETENRKFYKEMNNALLQKEAKEKQKSFGVLDRFVKKK